MEDLLENKLICRICLKVVDQTQQSYGNIEDETGTLRDMMLCCIPEMVNENIVILHIVLIFYYILIFFYLLGIRFSNNTNLI